MIVVVCGVCCVVWALVYASLVEGFKEVGLAFVAQFILSLEIRLLYGVQDTLSQAMETTRAADPGFMAPMQMTRLLAISGVSLHVAPQGLYRPFKRDMGAQPRGALA